MNYALDVHLPFGNDIFLYGIDVNPRGFGISSNGFNLCGTYPDPQSDQSHGYLVAWSPLGRFNAILKEDPAFVGVSFRGVNSAGDMVGFAVSSQPGPLGAPLYRTLPLYWPAHGDPVVFQFDAAKAKYSEKPGAANSALTGINDRGGVVGVFVDKQSDLPVGFVADIQQLLADPSAKQPATLRRLVFKRPGIGGATASVQPKGINNRGVVVGQVIDDGQCFVSVDGVNVMEFNVPIATTSSANGINDNNEIVGNYETAYANPTHNVAQNPQHGFRWRLDAKGNPVGVVEAVDYKVVIAVEKPFPMVVGGFDVYEHNPMTQLNGIDNFGTAVGTYQFTGNDQTIHFLPFIQRAGQRAKIEKNYIRYFGA